MYRFHVQLDDRKTGRRLGQARLARTTLVGYMRAAGYKSARIALNQGAPGVIVYAFTAESARRALRNVYAWAEAHREVTVRASYLNEPTRRQARALGLLVD